MNDVAKAVRDRIAHIRREAAPKFRPLQVSTVKKDARFSFMTIFLGGLILLMSSLTILVLVNKTGVSNQVAETKPPVERVLVERETVVQNPAYITREEFERRFDNIDRSIANLEKQFKTWSYRSWITAVVTNENALLAQELSRRYHPQYQPDYLKFDANWNVHRMPKMQSLTNEQRADIERGAFK
jgi:hypothetical protein